VKRALAVATLVLVACGSDRSDTGSSTDDVVDQDGVPRLGARIDRIGRPEITNFVVRDKALKQEFNAEDSFDMPEEDLVRYASVMKVSLGHYDAHDGTPDFDDETAQTLATVLADDQLRIDMSLPCDAQTVGYFTLVRSERRGVEPTTCGGRTPNEDVFDTLITLYTIGPTRNEPAVGDGVGFEASTGKAGNEFPYLAKPLLLRPRP
jgi:hypothetical protein